MFKPSLSYHIICLNQTFRRQVPWPFFSRELCREAHLVSANLNGGSEDFHGKGGKIAENRALTDVNRRYFGTYDRFSAVNRR